MARHLLLSLGILLCVGTAGTLWAQAHKKASPAVKKKKTAVAAGKTTAASANLVVPVYLGHSDISGGAIAPTLFDSLLRQGLTAKDAAGTVYPIKGFMFDYAERSMYEDEQANLFMQTEHMQQYCDGDTIISGLATNVYARLKAGDTVYIDHIALRFPDTTIKGEGRPMKFAIVH